LPSLLLSEVEARGGLSEARPLILRRCSG
jgi:hypothetical protein